ncbi:hypothetical protein [Bradyrhizobium elkanii]|uniref:hypothetical protein n=2 Tax=Bradyrhizobium elkanii TaxID=29448 RepID=UPI000571CEDA|nr:hypothetical protein [Bradyrhizobium elkanii]
MSKHSDHLTEEEVAKVLDLVNEADAVIVGGQCMAIWARFYAAYNPDISKIYTMSSEDVDFYATRKAAEEFAEKLGDAKLYLPGPDDYGPNSAKVVGRVGDREINVDFLHSIKGVDHASLKKNVLTLTGTTSDGDKSLKIKLMHPIDCFRSRLSNINDLHRKDVHSISTAKASVLVLDALMNDFLSRGWTKEAQDTLKTLRYVTLAKCYGTAAHLQFGIDPRWILEKYLTDDRLDERWRTFQLKTSLTRLDEKLAQIAASTKPK